MEIQPRQAYGGGVPILRPGSLNDDCGNARFAASVVVWGENPSMLRVITERQGDSYRLDLHGTLGAEWVGVLEQHWLSLLDRVPSAKLTLVLSNVDFIDPAGEQLLQRMADDDVEFVAAGCLNRYVIDRLKPAVRRIQGGRR